MLLPLKQRDALCYICAMILKNLALAAALLFGAFAPVMATAQAAKYRKRLKLAPWIELFLGCYFAAAIYYTYTNNNFFTAPFLILFVVGYWYTGLMSLLQGRFERWRSGTNTDEESSPKPFPVGV